jgi:polar amino acid transport system substrate-binding protein
VKPSGKSEVLVCVIGAGLLAMVTACGSSTSSSTSTKSSASSSSTTPSTSKVSYDPTLFNELPASIKASKEISVEQDSVPPFSVIGANGTVTGIGASLFPYLDKILGVTFKSVPANGIASADLGVTSGRAQIAFGPDLDTRTDEADFNFVDYLNALQGFVYLQPHSMTSLLSVCGKTVASIGGAAPVIAFAAQIAKDCTAAGKSPETMSYFSGAPQDVLAVEDGRAFAGLFSGYSAFYYQHTDPSKYGAWVVPNSDFPGIICGNLVGKNWGSLGAVYLAAIKILSQKGILQSVFSEWGLAPKTGFLLNTIGYNDYKANGSLGSS